MKDIVSSKVDHPRTSQLERITCVSLRFFFSG